MAHLLYFLENRVGASPEDLRAIGLGYALGDGCSKRQSNAGPGGCGGLCLSIDASVGYHEDRQRWIRIGSIPGAWVGCWNDNLPTEEELRKKTILPGHGVTLANGQEWIVPLAYEWREYDGVLNAASCVPAYSEIDTDGNWRRGEVRPEYKRLWEIAQFIWDVLHDPKNADKTFTMQDARNQAAEVLAVNYRVTKWECSLLRLFDDPANVSINVLRAITGEQLVSEWLKKKGTAESGIVSGAGGATA